MCCTTSDPCSYTEDGFCDCGGGQGLGPYHGTLHLPPALGLLAPTPHTGASGLNEIVVNAASDLLIEGSGAVSERSVRINLAGGDPSEGASVSCRAADDGLFIVPAEMLQAAGLGATSATNQLTITRSAEAGTFCGEGITIGRTSADLMLIVTVARLQ